MSNIAEILRQHRLRSLARSEAFSKSQERRVANKASHVKHILRGEDHYSSVPVTLSSLKDIYYNMIHTYRGTTSFGSYPKEMNDSSVALWMRVEKARQEVGCDAERYIKAQFVWFDKKFGTTPTTMQLATEAAVERAKEFTGSTKGRVLGNARKAPISKADIFRESEKILQKMMAAQGCNREDFYRKFVLTGLYTFPKQFLNADPAYKKIVNE